MFVNNKTTFLRREIMTGVAKVFFSGDLNELNRLPILVIPRSSTPNRCCIEKDRNLVKHRAIAAMGFDVDDEEEIDVSLLSDYAAKALERESAPGKILTFLDEACKSCIRVNYYVTDVCRNCVAKPCIINCPKNAIQTDENQAHIDKEKCVNCGICQKVCPFHAIVYVPVPCEESCPVGAIQKAPSGKQFIDYTKCIYCGKCIKSCPFGAIAEKSQITDVIKLLKSTDKKSALIAPAAAGQFPGTVKQLVSALRMLGFDNVIEVAYGADITVANESRELHERISAGDSTMGTSCCPAYIEAVNKHAQDFKKYVSHTKTPMIYTAEYSKEKYPDNKTVFIGPCIAKKHEGFNSDIIDYVLTFEELGSLLIAKGIDIFKCEEGCFDNPPASKEGRGFPVSQGVAGAVIAHSAINNKDFNIKETVINGLDKKNLLILKAYGKGKAPGNLVEVMACEGGCICGPGTIGNPKICTEKLEEYKKADG